MVEDMEAVRIKVFNVFHADLILCSVIVLCRQSWHPASSWGNTALGSRLTVLMNTLTILSESVETGHHCLDMSSKDSGSLRFTVSCCGQVQESCTGYRKLTCMSLPTTHAPQPSTSWRHPLWLSDWDPTEQQIIELKGLLLLVGPRINLSCSEWSIAICV